MNGHLQTRFVYASSAATYGDGRSGMDDQDEDIEKFSPNLWMVKTQLLLLAKKEGWLTKLQV